MNLDEEHKRLIKERKRLQHYEKYHTDEVRRQYHIEYQRRVRADPDYKEKRNQADRDRYWRKKGIAMSVI